MQRAHRWVFKTVSWQEFHCGRWLRQGQDAQWKEWLSIQPGKEERFSEKVLLSWILWDGQGNNGHQAEWKSIVLKLSRAVQVTLSIWKESIHVSLTLCPQFPSAPNCICVSICPQSLLGQSYSLTIYKWASKDPTEGWRHWEKLPVLFFLTT